MSYSSELLYSGVSRSSSQSLQSNRTVDRSQPRPFAPRHHNPEHALYPPQRSHSDRPRPIWNHAAPLNQIPERDLMVMEDCFERGDMAELEADINHLLEYLLPEPAWEDAAWELLQVGKSAMTPQPRPSRGIGQRFDDYI